MQIGGREEGKEHGLRFVTATVDSFLAPNRAFPEQIVLRALNISGHAGPVTDQAAQVAGFGIKVSGLRFRD